MDEPRDKETIKLPESDIPKWQIALGREALAAIEAGSADLKT